jgi:hypothetical protein
MHPVALVALLRGAARHPLLTPHPPFGGAEGHLPPHGGKVHAPGSGAPPETEQAARGWLLLIGSVLARSRACHVRAVFGIEEFFGKLNGSRTL